jgi:hypothetical protein
LKQAEVVIYDGVQAGLLSILGRALTTMKYDELLLRLVQRSWRQAGSRDEAISLLPLAYGLISYQPEISIEFCEAFTWVDAFLRG